MPRQKPLERAVQYVLKNWEKGEKLKEVSAQFSVDPGNLDRTFRNLLGTPIKKYTDTKLKLKVDSLLKDPGLTGYKIAHQLGMSDQTFYRWFKRMYKKSIREVRNNGEATPSKKGKPPK